MSNLMLQLRDAYSKEKPVIFPNKQYLFKAFRLTSFSNVRVIILGHEPYPSDKATGLAFANPLSDTTMSPALARIRSNTPSLGISTNVDLEKWASQGVLLLNTTLTVEEGNPGSHVDLWAPFASKMLELISENHSGLIFLLWEGNAKELKKHINLKLHYVIEVKDITPAVFDTANDILLKNNGVEYLIHW